MATLTNTKVADTSQETSPSPSTQAASAETPRAARVATLQYDIESAPCINDPRVSRFTSHFWQALIGKQALELEEEMGLSSNHRDSCSCVCAISQWAILSLHLSLFDFLALQTFSFLLWMLCSVI